LKIVGDIAKKIQAFDDNRVRRARHNP